MSDAYTGSGTCSIHGHVIPCGRCVFQLTPGPHASCDALIVTLEAQRDALQVELDEANRENLRLRESENCTDVHATVHQLLAELDEARGRANYYQMSYEEEVEVGAEKVAAAEASRDALADKVKLLLEWVVEIGYPYDFRTEPPIPEPFRGPLAATWYEHDGAGSEGETLRQYVIGCADEGGWPIASLPDTHPEGEGE